MVWIIKREFSFLLDYFLKESSKKGVYYRDKDIHLIAIGCTIIASKLVDIKHISFETIFTNIALKRYEK